MSTFVQLLPGGFATAAYRSTDATVFAPIEGQGRSTITRRALPRALGLPCIDALNTPTPTCANAK